MLVNPMKNGIVIDHIKAGNAMKIYNVLNLGDLKCSVAIIKNAESKKMGRKDILKIEQVIDLNTDILSLVDPGITINRIVDGVSTKSSGFELPTTIKGVIKCKNPRCITSIEQGIEHEFKLVDEKNKIYRCVYCEMKAKEPLSFIGDNM